MRLGFALANLAVATLLGVGVFLGLPQRWWVVDLPAGLAVVLLFAAGVGLLRPSAWSHAIARSASLFMLVAGGALFAALCLAAAYVWGVHGVLGRGVAIAYVVVVLPVGIWLVLFPAAQLAWLQRDAPSD